MKNILPNKLYDVLKWVAILALPAFAQFIPDLFTTWNIPYGEQIGHTLSLCGVLLGILLGISTVAYKVTQNKQSTTDEND